MINPLDQWLFLLLLVLWQTARTKVARNLQDPSTDKICINISFLIVFMVLFHLFVCLLVGWITTHMSSILKRSLLCLVCNACTGIYNFLHCYCKINVSQYVKLLVCSSLSIRSCPLMASLFLTTLLVCRFAVKNYASVVYMYVRSINVMPNPRRLIFFT